MAVTATYNGTVLAQSENTVYLEGNYYFPAESTNQNTFSKSSTAYSCPWKGNAVYYDATVDGKAISDIAWSYLQPKEAAKQIAGHLAFDKSKVKISK